MKKQTLIAYILLMQLSYINMAYGEIYKWIDEDGKTVYGDKPTSDKANKVIIKNHPKSDKHTQETYRKQKKLLEIMQEERDEKIALKEEDAKKKEKQKKKCLKAIQDLQETKDASLLYEKTDDPYNPKIYSEEERKAEEEKYEKYIKANCL
jgi:uncharacterized protein DUF4124